jgi:hypothetical protein
MPSELICERQNVRLNKSVEKFDMDRINSVMLELPIRELMKVWFLPSYSNPKE